MSGDELQIAPEGLEIVGGSVQQTGVPGKAMPISELEVPAPEGPFGAAKGVGEAPVVGAPGAVASAIAPASQGLRMRRLPMTSERVRVMLCGTGASAA